MVKKRSTCFERVLLASKCSPPHHQSCLVTLLPLSGARMFYFLQTKPNIQLRKEISGGKRSTCAEGEVLASKRQSFYRQYILEPLMPLSKTPMFYRIKTKRNIQPRKEIMGENQVLSSKRNYWDLIVRLATVNRAQKLCCPYRTRSCSDPLNQT